MEQLHFSDGTVFEIVFARFIKMGEKDLFDCRIEGNFEDIKAHLSSPGNYYWENLITNTNISLDGYSILHEIKYIPEVEQFNVCMEKENETEALRRQIAELQAQLNNQEV